MVDNITVQLRSVIVFDILSVILIKVRHTIIHKYRAIHCFWYSKVDNTVFDSELVGVLPSRILELSGILIMKYRWLGSATYFCVEIKDIFGTIQIDGFTVIFAMGIINQQLVHLFLQQSEYKAKRRKKRI